MTACIEVSGVNLEFPLYHAQARSLKKRVFATVAGRVGQDARHRVVVQALRDVGFSLRSGERLGLVGGNGAGKTTLLRTLAGIYEPVSGHVRVEGSLNALLDQSMGMNPELTGRENIRLRGLMQGLSQAAIGRLEDDVRDFADLGDFLELPVRTFSAGMMVRLGFAMATAIRPQVLLMDEWLLAGDASFMEKARARIGDLVRNVEILVLSSHSVEIVRTWCTRLLWLDQGRVRADGDVTEVLEAYLGYKLPPLVEAVGSVSPVGWAPIS
jgi:lipopolysaccharide transport system ATP-binding protein